MPGPWVEAAFRQLQCDHEEMLAALGVPRLKYSDVWPAEAGHLYFVESPGSWTNFVCRSELLGDEVVVSFFGGQRYRRRDFEGKWRFALIPDYYRPGEADPGPLVDVAEGG